jgi:maltose alpha-D-glucosyltransferase / alpha-amylase
LLVDFEGEPARSLGERRMKRSPLRDVAGMIRSFDYAAHTALFRHRDDGTLPVTRMAGALGWAECWQRWVSAAFFRAYRETAEGAGFLPTTDEELMLLMDVHLLEKAIYELGYELSHRPAWLGIPLRGIRQLMGEEL